MRRIVQIGSYPVSGSHVQGGVEASVFGLSQELGKIAEVHVFDMPRIGGEHETVRDGMITVHRFRNEGKRQFITIAGVATIAKEIIALHPNICHIHGTSLFAWLMYRNLKHSNLKLIVTVHGLVLVEKHNLLKKRFSFKRFAQYLYQGAVEKRFLSELTMVIVDTQYVKEMVNAYPIRRKPEIHVIPQGVNESFFSIKCSDHSSMFLSVGAIGDRKGHLLTIKAFELLRDSGVNAKLSIAGTIADSTYYNVMQNVVDESNYKNDITLYSNLSNKELRDLYESAHVFVLHSEEESQGIVFVEAMALGMPVVSTKVGGVPFVVKDGVTGLLSEFGDVESFARNMERLVTNKKEWQVMSIEAQQEAQNYHWSSVCNEVIQLYNCC